MQRGEIYKGQTGYWLENRQLGMEREQYLELGGSLVRKCVVVKAEGRNYPLLSILDGFGEGAAPVEKVAVLPEELLNEEDIRKIIMSSRGEIASNKRPIDEILSDLQSNQRVGLALGFLEKSKNGPNNKLPDDCYNSSS